MSFCNGIRLAIYLSRGIMKLSVNSIKWRFKRAVCASPGLFVWIPLNNFFNIVLSFWRKGLYCV